MAFLAFSFGLGFGLVIVVAGILYKYRQETRPWTSPMRATFTGLQLRQPTGMVNLEFDYAIENPTNKDYKIPSGSSVLMRLPDGNEYAGAEQAHVSLENENLIQATRK
jgi:hypothetical protein